MDSLSLHDIIAVEIGEQETSGDTIFRRVTFFKDNAPGKSTQGLEVTFFGKDIPIELTGTLSGDPNHFPTTASHNAEWDKHHDYMGKPMGDGGMTIRQYYKAAALMGLLACEAPHYSRPWNNLTHVAGEIADAAIAEDEEHERES